MLLKLAPFLFLLSSDIYVIPPVMPPIIHQPSLILRQRETLLFPINSNHHVPNNQHPPPNEGETNLARYQQEKQEQEEEMSGGEAGIGGKFDGGYIGLSFIIKNTLILIVAFIYFYFYSFLNRAKKSIKKDEEQTREENNKRTI